MDPELFPHVHDSVGAQRQKVHGRALPWLGPGLPHTYCWTGGGGEEREE